VPLCHEISLCHIAVIISGETSRVLALLMSEYSLSPRNIINLISFLSLSIVVPVFLGSGSLNIRYVHLITNEFGWGDGAGLHFGKVIHRRQGVVPKTVSSELNAFRGSSFDVTCSKIIFRFVQLNVEGCWLGACNVPVGIRKLRLVHVFGPVKSWRSTYYN
jgi:hypothetical protein